jgi:pheromone shutdown protein TraB
MDVVGTLNNPRSNESSINRVSAAWNTERDKHLVRQIADAKAQGKKPFVVFGASHAVSVEQALKAL